MGRKAPPRIYQVDARQVVLQRDLLGSEMLLNGNGIVRAALHRGIVGHHHARRAVDAADAGNETGGGNHVVVELEAGQLADFEKRRAAIEQAPYSIPRQQFAAPDMAFARALVAAESDVRDDVRAVRPRAVDGGGSCARKCRPQDRVSTPESPRACGPYVGVSEALRTMRGMKKRSTTTHPSAMPIVKKPDRHGHQQHGGKRDDQQGRCRCLSRRDNSDGRRIRPANTKSAYAKATDFPVSFGMAALIGRTRCAYETRV